MLSGNWISKLWDLASRWYLCFEYNNYKMQL